MSFLLWLILHLIISFALSCSYEWMEHKGGPRDCNDNNHDNTNNDNINNNNILLIITMIIILQLNIHASGSHYHYQPPDVTKQDIRTGKTTLIKLVIFIIIIYLLTYFIFIGSLKVITMNGKLEV